MEGFDRDVARSGPSPKDGKPPGWLLPIKKVPPPSSTIPSRRPARGTGRHEQLTRRPGGRAASIDGAAGGRASLWHTTPSVLSYESITIKYLLGCTLHETLMEVTMAIGRPIPPLHLSTTNARASSAGSGVQPLPRMLRSAIPDHSPLQSEGKTNTVVAGEIGLAKQTVGKLAGCRFIERRLDGLLDEPMARRPTLHHGHRCGAGP